MPASVAAKKARNAPSGTSPMAKRAKAEATASRASLSRATGAQCSKRPPPGPAPALRGKCCKPSA
eukprot:4953897-Lingulodinium_polyedra.AAC.1